MPECTHCGFSREDFMAEVCWLIQHTSLRVPTTCCDPALKADNFADAVELVNPDSEAA